MLLLKPIYEATKLLSSSSYPTLGDLLIAFCVIIEILIKPQNESDIIKKNITIKI
ncbi:9837_t:CDS:1, partial [Cetraspora pellucida]